MSKAEQERKELAKKMVEKQKEIDEITKIESKIKDNKIEFLYKKETYRVRKPSQVEARETDYQKNIKKQELFRDPNYLFSKQWEELYRQKGEDVNEINKKMEEIRKKIEEAEVDLDALREENVQDEDVIKKAKEKLLKTQGEWYEQFIRKTKIYEYSIETVLNDFENRYPLYLVLEKKCGNKWKRAFDTYKDFLNTEEDDLLLIAKENLELIIINYKKQNANLR